AALEAHFVRRELFGLERRELQVRGRDAREESAALRTAGNRGVQQLRLLRLILEPGAPRPVAVIDGLVDESERHRPDKARSAGRAEQATEPDRIQVGRAAGVLPLFPRVAQTSHEIELVAEVP